MESFKYYDHLGFHNPYYIIEENKITVEPSFEKIIERIPNDQRILDYTALAQVFSTGYCFGDRTLIKGLKKTPWMAKPNSNYTDWEYFTVPAHEEAIVDKEQIASNFYNLLEEELIDYVESHHNVGILLTGGMDSRIVAALLKNAIERGKLSDKKVYAYTWGHEKSRDVVYASKIAEMYGWSWKHLIVDKEQMEENCRVAIANGCEFTPIHLHAMPQVARERHLDCVLAGSFGDSVGRAEFSGKKVRELVSLENNIKNVGGLLRHDFYRLVIDNIRKDIKGYHQLFPQKHLYQQYEQDQQLHYMRRMLNSCMSIIDKTIPLYQIFTSPKVFGYMWSLHPRLRSDDIYKDLLKSRAPELLKIPWARTGLTYPETEGTPDGFTKKHHDYGKLVRESLIDSIEETVTNNKAISQFFFNERAIRMQIRNIKKFPIRGSQRLEEKLLYVSQVLKFINHYGISNDLSRYYNLPIMVEVKDNLLYYGKYLRNKLWNK